MCIHTYVYVIYTHKAQLSPKFLISPLNLSSAFALFVFISLRCMAAFLRAYQSFAHQSFVYSFIRAELAPAIVFVVVRLISRFNLYIGLFFVV